MKLKMKTIIFITNNQGWNWDGMPYLHFFDWPKIILSLRLAKKVQLTLIESPLRALE